ncbi:MAG: DUF664 domain-containing protein [Anaerolineales bacterium]|nr:DUF664 domain-containing protein [Anaerolineales bacterium]
MHPIFTAYLDRLEQMHTDIKQAVDGLPQAALDWSPGAEINSIAVLIAHTAGAERFWIVEQAGGDTVNRDRSAEFSVEGAALPTLLALLDESTALAQATLERLAPDDLTRPASSRPVDAAWALWHALEHTAQHSGHIQLTRQWWNQWQKSLSQG